MRSGRAALDDLLRMRLEELVELIARVNWCWHSMRDREADGAVTAALRDRKTALQLELLRDYPSRIRLVRHDSGSDPLYSIRLMSNVRLRDGRAHLLDAMHIRVEQVHAYLTEQEIEAVSVPQDVHEVNLGQ